MSRGKVLIVDDTPQNIHVLMETLKDEHAIVAATNGAKALQLALREPQPDLILLDVMMPEMSGYEVCERLKLDPKTESIPVIFVTALHEAGDEERGLALGAVDYITKPFHPALVKARVRNQLELKRHRDDLQGEVQRRTDQLLAVQLLKQKLDQELELARTLQLSMLHNQKYHWQERLVVDAYLEPARAVGGDLYDYLLLSPTELLVVIADVSDKGVPAALFMVRVLTLLRSMAPQTSSPAALLKSVNKALCQDNDTFMFVTVSSFVLDLSNGHWTYASGGHEPPVLIKDGLPQLLELETGAALGLNEEVEFTEHHGQLGPHDRIVLYTDGVTEAERGVGEFFGVERLLRAATPPQSGPQSKTTKSRIIESLEEFTAGAEQSDDLTLVVIRMPGEEEWE